MIARPKLVAMIVACAFFMQNLDGTIVATALPPIARSFDTDPVRLSTVITAYLLSVAVFIPISGWVADRFGGAHVFRAALALFTLGSVLCGVAGGPIELSLARIVQGMGGAMMIPVGRLVLLRSVTKAEFVETMTYLMVPAQVGMALGPPVGGWITTYASWRWIFLMNLPIGLLGIALVTRFIPNRREGERHPLDWLGFILSGTSLAALMYGVEAIRDPAASAMTIAGCLAGGGLVAVAALFHMRRHPHPIIDLSLLKVPTFRISFAGGTPFRLAWGACAFMLPLLFQVGLGMTAFASGLLIFAGALGNVSMKPATRPILKRWGFRNTLLWNALLSATFMLICAFYGADLPAYVIFGSLFVGGFFQSFQFTGLNTMAYADIPPAKMSGATSLAQMAQQVSSTFGVALAAALLQGTLVAQGATRLNIVDFRIAFPVMAAFALLSLPALRSLPPDAAADISGHVPRGARRAAESPRGV